MTTNYIIKISNIMLRIFITIKFYEIVIATPVATIAEPIYVFKEINSPRINFENIGTVIKTIPIVGYAFDKGMFLITKDQAIKDPR